MTGPRDAATSAHYHHGDLRNACIGAALALLAQQGRSAVTLREVARRIGVSRSAPYRHFADKRGLLAACATRGFVQLRARAQPVLDQASAPDMNTLRLLLHRYAQFGAADPHLYRLMFASDFKSEEYPELTREGERAFALLHNTVCAGQRAGRITRSDTYGLVLALWAAVHGLVSLCNDLSPSDVLDTTALEAHVERVFSILSPAIAAA